MLTWLSLQFYKRDVSKDLSTTAGIRAHASRDDVTGQ